MIAKFAPFTHSLSIVPLEAHARSPLYGFRVEGKLRASGLGFVSLHKGILCFQHHFAVFDTYETPEVLLAPEAGGASLAYRGRADSELSLVDGFLAMGEWQP